MNDLECSYKSKKYDGKTSCQFLKLPFGKCCHSLKKGIENVKRLIIPSETTALVSFYSRPQLENTLPCSELLGERACLRLSRPHSVAVVQLSTFLSLSQVSVQAGGAASGDSPCCLEPPEVLEPITYGRGTDFHVLSSVNLLYNLSTTQYCKYLSSSINTFSSRINILLEYSQVP